MMKTTIISTTKKIWTSFKIKLRKKRTKTQTRSSKKLYIDALALVQKNKSGVGQTLEQTLESLLLMPDIKKDWSIYLVVPLGKGKYLKRYNKTIAHIKTIYFPARILNLLLGLRLLPPLDIFLGQGIYLFPNYRNWPLCRSRSLTYIYDLSFVLFPETVQPRNRKYLTNNIENWITNTDVIITITHWMRQAIETYFNDAKNKVKVVYCGVNKNLFYARSNKEIQIVKKRYNITYKQYILFVGNLEPRKNLSLLISAYLGLPKELKDKYGLVIVGSDGWLNGDLLAQIATEDAKGQKIYKVQKYVNNEDLPAIYSGATLLVHPAIYEGFGLTPLEAIACGTQVLVSDIPAAREILGDAPVYFNPYSVNNLQHKIIDSLTNQQKVPNIAVDNFSWEQSARTLYNYIDEQNQLGLRKISFKVILKTMLHRIDLTTLRLLGDKQINFYQPQSGHNKAELLKKIYISLLDNEQSVIQKNLLSGYNKMKNCLIKILKKTRRVLKMEHQ